jgi:hypothetical protein
MTTVGGNVKELCTAASEGKVDIVKYHLDMGMDPNFQHPEFMTTPLIEAARFGRTAVVQLLLERGKADPTVTADFEGCTALEEAMKEGHHDVVDLILPRLPEESDYDRECLIIWITTGTAVASPPRVLLRHFLVKGHCVLWTVDTDQAAVQLSTIAKDLRCLTGNRKLFLLSHAGLGDFFAKTPDKKSAWHPPFVDVWLHWTKAADITLIAKELEAFEKPLSLSLWQIPFRKGAPRLLLSMVGIRGSGVIESDVEVVVHRVLSRKDKDFHGHCCVMGPLTWKEKLIYALWGSQAWCDEVLESVARLSSR